MAIFLDEDTGEVFGTRTDKRGRIFADDGLQHRADTKRYTKNMLSNYFFDLELSAMELRCWRIIGFYLNAESEFFYMTKSAMLVLLEKHFQRAYNERVVQNALNRLEKIGAYIKVKDGLCMINHNIIFNGDRGKVLFKHYEFDLFGMRDPMERNAINKDVSYSKDVLKYIYSFNISIPKERAKALGILRKTSRLKNIT
jgi:hypothetical protein